MTFKMPPFKSMQGLLEQEQSCYSGIFRLITAYKPSEIKDPIRTSLY